MPTLPAQKLRAFYEQYKDREIAFNRSILNITGLETRKVFIKIRGDQWPCIVYSCSMRSAKVIIKLDAEDFEAIKKAKNFVSLRLSFAPKHLKSPILFFVPSIVKGFNTFKLKRQNSFLMTLDFTQRPPDDLIEVLGKIFLSIENFEKRKELRINLDNNVIKEFGIKSTQTLTVIDNIKRPGILKNISSSGCFLVMVCNPKFIMNKKIRIIVGSNYYSGLIELEGTIVRSEDVTGRKDIFGLGIIFDKEKIPFEFKEMMNEYLDNLEEIARQKRKNSKVSNELDEE